MSSDKPYRLLFGDSNERLLDLKENSVDAVVTDPPYELGFMGKSWDASGIAYSVEFWEKVLRVMKPGAHILAFGGTALITAWCARWKTQALRYGINCNGFTAAVFRKVWM